MRNTNKRPTEMDIFFRPAKPNEIIVGTTGRGKRYDLANKENHPKSKESSSNFLTDILPSTSNDA